MYGLTLSSARIGTINHRTHLRSLAPKSAWDFKGHGVLGVMVWLKVETDTSQWTLNPAPLCTSVFPMGSFYTMFGSCGRVNIGGFTVHGL